MGFNNTKQKFSRDKQKNFLKKLQKNVDKKQVWVYYNSVRGDRNHLPTLKNFLKKIKKKC